MKKKKKLKQREYSLDDPKSKKEYNEKLFSIIAPYYNVITRILSFGSDKKWKNLLVKRLPVLEKPVCLDLACGTGDICRKLANKYPGARITGVDINENMLLLAQNTTFNNEVKYANMNMADLKYEPDQFDLVTGSYALRNSPELNKTIEQIHRILKHKGTAAFLDFSKSHRKFWQAVVIFILNIWGSIWGFFFHGNREIYAYIAESLKRFPDRIRIKEMFKNSGFDIIFCKTLFFGILEILIVRKN